MSCKSYQKGAALVEFALTILIFMTAFMGVIELSRLGFALNSASEVTRIAARLGSICSMGSEYNPIIQKQVQDLIGASGLVDTTINPQWLHIKYLTSSGGSCSVGDCVIVQASIPNLQFKPLIIPGINFQLTTEVSSIAVREGMSDMIGAVVSNGKCF